MVTGRAPWQTPWGRVRRLLSSGLRMLRNEGWGAFGSRLRYRLGERDWLPRARPGEEYAAWMKLHTPGPAALREMAAECQAWPDRRLVSILMPVYNSEPHWLEDAVGSVLAQTYDRWQLCVVDDASPAAHVRPLLARLAARDARVEVVHREANGGIAAATQTALEMARGEFVGLLDHDDVLQAHALQAMVARLRQDEQLDLVYSDEDKLLTSGYRGEPFFKPDWSPDLLLSTNYLAHFTVVRHSLLLEAGGFRPGYDGSQDHDIFLRVVERCRRIGHVSDILYSWRQVPGSAALAGAEKPYAHEAGRRAVADALERRGVAASVQLGKRGHYVVRYKLAGRPRLAVIVWGPGAESWDPASDYPALEVLRVEAVERPWAALNTAAGRSSADHLLFVNAQLEPRRGDWLESLLEHSQRPEVGAAGGRLLRPDGWGWQEGLGLELRQVVAPVAYAGYFRFGETVRDVAAVSADCLITRRELFAELGGFSPDYRRLYADVDYCLRARDRGLLVVFTPRAPLRWRSEPTATHEEADDARRLRAAWGDQAGRLRDPYLGPYIIPEGRVAVRTGQD